MDNKFYVSLDAARLLKEKGYNEEVELFYNTLGELEEVNGMFCCDVADNTQMTKYNYCSAPTKAEAIDWLESKGIVVEAFYTRHHWFFSIIDFNVKQKIFADEYYPTRLEAEEAAIIKALELL